MNKLSSPIIAALLLSVSAPSALAAFDFLGLILGDGSKVIIDAKGFNPTEVTVTPGTVLEFSNESTQSLRIVVPDLKLATDLINPGDQVRVPYPRIGTYETHCGSLCEKPLKVTVALKQAN